MKKLLWAILLVLIGIVFPIAWIIIVPLLVLLIVSAILEAIFAPIKRYSRQNIFTQEFCVSEEELFRLLIKTISSLGYKLESADKDSGLITFKTGTSMSTFSGQEGTIVIVPTGANTCNVQINMSFKGQLLDWGEGNKIANKILDKLNESVPRIDKKEEGRGSEEPEEYGLLGLLKAWWNANKGIKN